MILRAVAALLLAAFMLPAQQATAQDAAAADAARAKQAWWVYAGGMAARSAMDSLSVVRTGNIARFNEVVVSTAGQWKTGDLPFDYMAASIEYDCAGKTARAVRIEYFDRAGKSLKITSTPDSAFISGAEGSEFTHFAPVACRDLSVGTAPGQHETLAGFLAAYAFWNIAARK
ncbi:surface-adhesin E family protein [Sandarakinorhabdus sp.]|uniref:surface-adhesin E family protein n=1 Tax=Sandarakinorhabdus sp. TaxID=1916663 RepID=UPI00286E8986|nr:surface-adhesin E family protein [Sandarakinorhabdus sp.]